MPLSDHDIERTRRAVSLARKGFFQVEPNPPVGCVIERGEEGVVGEGWHAAYGGPHAEVAALRLAADRAQGATAYVSLAPCGQHGKTPPCADALVQAGVTRVVYAAADPSPVEQHAGLERLRRAGVEVEGPVELVRAEAEALLERFQRMLDRTRPWTVLKWAMSLDGSIAPKPGVGGAISGRRARILTHEWRGSADAVAVGVGTILADDPLLTCRLEDGPPFGRSQPKRVVFDTHLRTPVDGRLAMDAYETPVILMAGPDADPERRKALEAAGCSVEVVPLTVEGRLDLEAALERLGTLGIRRLLVEGGADIHGSLLTAGLADQVSAYVAPRILGGADAVPAVRGTPIADAEEALVLEDVMWRRLGDDLLMQGYVPPIV